MQSIERLRREVEDADLDRARSIAISTVTRYRRRSARFCRQAVSAMAKGGGCPIWGRREVDAALTSDEAVIVTIWLTGRVVAVNHPALEMLRERPSGIEDRRLWDIIPEDDDDALYWRREAIWRHGAITSDSMRVRRRDGTIATCRASLFLATIIGGLAVVCRLMPMADKKI